MKKIILLLLFSSSIYAQSIKNSCETIATINTFIQSKHYKPRKLNDSLSLFVYNNFLEKLDPNNAIFLDSDITSLSKYKLKIDNYINAKDCKFLDDFYNAYNIGTARKNNILSAILKEPFALSSNEIIHFSKKRFPYSKSNSDLKKLFKKRILFEILSEIAQTSENRDSIITNYKNISEAAKTKVFDNYTCKEKDEVLTKDKFYSIFINTFCSYFDPHTNYFSNNEKSDFLSGLSSTNYSFGFSVTLNKKSEMIVTEIIPGGAAFYSKKIEVGDIITKINVGNENLEIKCNNYQLIDQKLNGNDTKKAIFTFRKNTGEIYSAELLKQLMADINNRVYSYILDYNNQKTGYIKIPSFYSQFENGKTDVSDDFKKELLKLNNQKIKNLIIDLEDNTGGSMQEAIKLCGFFIEAPVVGQQKMSGGKVFMIANESAKTLFSGNIFILINGNSASASEFFTNAMQDYNLAIVVGTKSYGKASIQEIFELANESKDFLKLTIGTFYRVTGKSNQAVGINPTITIPTIYDDQLSKEKDTKNYLRNENIKPFITKNSYPFSEKQKMVIQEYTSETNKNNSYHDINILKKRLDNLFGDKIAPIKLNFTDVFNNQKMYNNLFKDISKYEKTIFKFDIFKNSYDNNNEIRSISIIDSDEIGVKKLKSNYTVFQTLKISSKLN